MCQSEQGLVPAPNLGQRLVSALRDSTLYRNRIQSLEWEVIELHPLLDSANMQPRDWETISTQCIEQEEVDALVVVHGTDTLAYSAGALAFLLQNIPVPVVITGAQKPLGFTPGDALDNLAGAMLAARDAESGVWVYFHRQMMPAARVVKKDAISFTAFDAPRLRDGVAHPPAISISPQPQLRSWSDIQVCTVHMAPGYQARHLRALLSCQPDAIILSLYGRGTLADHDQELVETIGQAVQKGVIAVAISQCYIGDIDFKVYATGAVLEQLGVLNGRDMTLEASYTKLMVLLRLGYSCDQIKQLYLQNIANEITTNE